MAQGRGRKKSIAASLDWVVILVYLALLAMGWMSVCGASYEPDMARGFLDFSTRSGMQIVWIGTSILLAIIILCTDENVYETFSYFFYALFMLVLLATPFLAHEIKGSLSWIKIGTFSIQPAEFAKFATALCIAKYISRPEFSMQKRGDFIMTWFIILLPMALIVLQKETGCALVYFAFFFMLYREGLPACILFTGIAAIVYFVVGVRFEDVSLLGMWDTAVGPFTVMSLILFFTLCMAKEYKPPRATFPFWWMLCVSAVIIAAAILVSIYVYAFNVTFAVVALLAMLVLYLLFKAISERTLRYLYIALFAIGSMGFHFCCDKVMDDVLEQHQRQRILVLLGMEDDPRGAGYNVIQAKIAIGSGGLQGKGFLNGTQTKLKYVPEQDTDFIFCTVGEEEGFAGCAFVLALFLVLILRLIVLAERQPDTMGRVYGYCVASIFFFHVFINVGMVLGLTPVIGIPLPFFSYGGSSLWGFTLLLFIFLRMDAAHKHLRR